MIGAARIDDVDYVFDELIALYSESRIPDFVALADALSARREALFAEALDGYRDHVDLLACWPTLNEVVRAKGFPL